MWKIVSYVSGLKTWNKSPSNKAVTEPPFYYTTATCIEQYLIVVVFIILYKAILQSESVDEILTWISFNESYWTVLTLSFLKYKLVLTYEFVYEILKHKLNWFKFRGALLSSPSQIIEENALPSNSASIILLSHVDWREPCSASVWTGGGIPILKSHGKRDTCWKEPVISAL